MVEKMRKAHRAAALFLSLMKEEHEPTYSTDPEKVEAFLHAFLAAAKTVTMIARREHDQWFWDWHDGRGKEDRAYIDFLSDKRDAWQHRGEEDFDRELHLVPYSSPVATVQGMRMPGEQGPPSSMHVARFAYTFPIPGLGPVEMIAACERYLPLLDAFIQDFVASHPPQ
jgi:hypothetical protein